MTFTHSGATGDIIFSLPTIKAMGGGRLLIHQFHRQRYESVKPLLEVQEYITEVDWIDHKPEGSVDLDKFRKFAGHHKNLVDAHFSGQDLTPTDWKGGWLTLPDRQVIIPGLKYSVINRTTNYADPNCDWIKEVEYLRAISDEVFFIGYPEEWNIFCDKFTPVKYFPCDFLQAAHLIMGAEMFTGCYSALSTIAMGLGINYRLEQAPGHSCSSLLQPRETIINV